MAIVKMASEEYVDGKVGEKYTKPNDGIPKDDLAESVQASLGKADTAIQQHQDISGKADKSTTYTKTDVDAIVQALKTGSRQIVETLPASGQPMVIYMVPKSTSQTNNAYDEYIWTAAGAWEKIGDTEIDLSGYYTKTATNALLEAKQDTISDLAAIRSGAAAGATAYQKPNGGITASDLSAAVQTSLGKADTALQQHQDITGKADKVAIATSGNLAALDANGNLVDSEKDPSDFVQIGETNTQPYDEYIEGLVYPLFSVEAGYYNSGSGEWVQNALMTFGADAIRTTDIIGSTSLSPNFVVVDDGGMIATSTMTGSSVETPLLYTGALWGQSGYGIGDIELSEYCFVHSPYDESAGGYAYSAMGTEIMRVGNDYEAGTLGPLLDVKFDSYGTIGYPDPYTGDTTWATVESVVSAANGWSYGFPVVDALTVQNYGTLSLQGGWIEFQDLGNYYYLSSSDAARIGSLYAGYWVYQEYDPGTGGYSEQQIDAAAIASILYAYGNYGFVTTGTNYVQSGQSSLFSVVDDYSYETVFTGRTVEFGIWGSAYTVVSDSGVTAPSLELNDGNTSVTLSPSELQQLKALISNP